MKFRRDMLPVTADGLVPVIDIDLKGSPAAYGSEEVRAALEQGRVKTLVLNNSQI